jgi:hypothetical protein
MAKRYLAKRRKTEDASGLAGWLFTDLLLGLVMIFLSAVAFTAFKPKAALVEGEVALECKEYVAAFVPEPLSLTYTSTADALNIGSQIQTYVDTEQEINGVSQKLKDAKVAVGIIYGYFSGTNNFEGVNRAKSYYSEFVKSDSNNFPPFETDKKDKKVVKNMRFIGSAGENAPTNGVRAELFFVYQGCSKFGPVSPSTAP